MFIYLQGHEEIVDLLIQNKVGVNIVDKNDRTALFWAAESGNLGQFLKTAVSPKLKTCVIFTGQVRIMDLLINHGARIDIRDLHGSTPLHLAVENGHAEAVEWFVTYKANVNLLDTNGHKSALLLATQKG